MNVGTYCRHRVITVDTKADLCEAARVMREEHVGMLVAVDADAQPPRPLGVLTDRDIVVQVVAREADPRAIKVGDAMTRDPLTVRETELLTLVSERMRSHGVRRVPVVNDQGTLVGIIAADDILDIAAVLITNLSDCTHREQRTEARTRAM